MDGNTGHDRHESDGTHYSRIFLSSDHMLAGAKPGQHLTADYMERWVAEAKAIWLANCIEKGLNWSGGDLGNGQQLWGGEARLWLGKPVPPAK